MNPEMESGAEARALHTLRDLGRARRDLDPSLPRRAFRPAVLIACVCALLSIATLAGDRLQTGFQRPPHEARPWVYWFWMDGNVSREGITADLEAMKQAGIGGMILMEVDVGIPRGPVRFMSDPWQALFAHAVHEAQRLGLEITLNAGPGWTGSGGPWVKPDQSMQHLVASTLTATGPTNLAVTLPQPKPRDPHFVHAPIPASLRAMRDNFYRDVAVIAYPTPTDGPRIANSDELALYYRNPYSSSSGVPPFLAAPAEHAAVPAGTAIERQRIVELTDRLESDGRLAWSVPPGSWTIMRFGRTSTGANTRPAPEPGIGLESDKFDRAALEAHFENYVGTLLRRVGGRPARSKAGWTMLHIDSWEMGAQNWTAKFRDEFRHRRGYDPLPYLPAMTGHVVASLEESERFLWDLRLTAQELVVENHAQHLKELGRRHGFGLSIEPYDLNPCADLSLGGVADIPMCEFWAKDHGFDTSFSCFEAVSIAHTMGRPVTAAEAFTAVDSEAWRLHPGVMKAQADWAFCVGINRLVFHRYAHQPWLDRRPGMTMGPYGVHYERTQTWWPLVNGWHDYLARCQFLLQQGLPVADICYVAAEGAPHVFRPPRSAVRGPQPLPDRRGYNFDGCAPETVVNRMSVRNGRLVLPDGMSYRLLVLPEMDTMTPGLLRKVKELVEGGATVIGPRPKKSPSLAGFPASDREVQDLALVLWGPAGANDEPRGRAVGRGRVIRSPGAEPVESLAVKQARIPDAAHWIWQAEGKPAQSAPVGTRHFRRSITIEPTESVESALMLVTADNAFQAAVNGALVGAGDNFRQVYALDIAAFLKPGENLLTIAADNGGEAPNPAGLIASVDIRFRSGRVLTLHTDSRWESSASAAGPWQAALDLGALGIGPWGDINQPSAPPTYPDLYPGYSQAAGALAQMAVPPDFEADATLRYIHRRVGKSDLYFVANGTDSTVQTRCRFRVEGRQPELWDPMTGQIRALAEFSATGGRTTVPLTFDPNGSVFIVFRHPTGQRLPASPNTITYTGVAEVRGPWEVRFEPGRGAPESVRLDQLADWSQHADPRVRFFSGLATYTTHFEILERGAGSFLDLGRVAVMARVTVNGRQVGTVWKAPYRLDITDLVQTGSNTLVVEVANLWPNRLIGDRSVPEAERTTWTTWDPFKAGAPLLESGLLGPVTLVRQQTRR